MPRFSTAPRPEEDFLSGSGFREARDSLRTGDGDQKSPDDHEASVFHALSLPASAPDLNTTLENLKMRFPFSISSSSESIPASLTISFTGADKLAEKNKHRKIQPSTIISDLLLKKPSGQV